MGRANECGILEDPYAAPPEDAFDLTTPLEETPDKQTKLSLHLNKVFQYKLMAKIIN